MSSELVKALQNPAIFPHPTGTFQVLETHISWVILTGDYAYKIKKPVDFGFLNFTTLERRRHFCEEELRLNHRLAAPLYLDVVPISGTAEHPVLNGDGEPIEFAIRMRQFDQAQLLDQLNAQHALTADHIDQIAGDLARFHAGLPRVSDNSPLGTAESVFAPMQQNVDQIRPMLEQTSDLAQLTQLEAWTRDTFTRLAAKLEQRRANGFIRECHGDLHLGNITLFEGRVTIFDCIEFNDEFRWIDVFNDLAFLLMDLEDRDQQALAFRLLNLYLEQTGDYAALELLPLYKAYRAMVRAKIALFTRCNPSLNENEREALLQRYRRYALLAETCSTVPKMALVVTRGVSGSGKSVVALALAEAFGGIRIRSDIERKRLFGLDALADSDSAGIRDQLYTPEATQRTYDELARLAGLVLGAGLPVVIDAACLRQAERAHFEALAESRGVQVLILSCEAPIEVLEARLLSRQAAGKDPSEANVAILHKQLAWQEPLTETEDSHTINLQTCRAGAIDELIARLRAY